MENQNKTNSSHIDENENQRSLEEPLYFRTGDIVINLSDQDNERSQNYQTWPMRAFQALTPIVLLIGEFLFNKNKNDPQNEKIKNLEESLTKATEKIEQLSEMIILKINNIEEQLGKTYTLVRLE